MFKIIFVITKKAHVKFFLSLQNIQIPNSILKKMSIIFDQFSFTQPLEGRVFRTNF